MCKSNEFTIGSVWHIQIIGFACQDKDSCEKVTMNIWQLKCCWLHLMLLTWCLHLKLKFLIISSTGVTSEPQPVKIIRADINSICLWISYIVYRPNKRVVILCRVMWLWIRISNQLASVLSKSYATKKKWIDFLHNHTIFSMILFHLKWFFFLNKRIEIFHLWCSQHEN